MSEPDKRPDDRAPRARNTAADIDGVVVQTTWHDGDVNIIHPPPGRWYRDRTVMVPATVAIIAIVPSFILHEERATNGTGEYVEPEECLELDWPDATTAAAPQKVQTKEDVDPYAILRQKPCWRAPTPPLTSFTPETGITVLCRVNADNVYDTAGIPRYGWYLVADPHQREKPLGWTPEWPYAAPDRDVPECAQSASLPVPLITIAAAITTILAAVFLITAIKRRHRALRHPRDHAGPRSARRRSAG
jgi:hypothetical protein